MEARSPDPGRCPPVTRLAAWVPTPDRFRQAELERVAEAFEWTRWGALIYDPDWRSDAGAIAVARL